MTTKTITTDRPITLHGLCHVPHSFCDGTELCSIAYQKLLPAKTGTRLTDTRASFWYQTTGTSFCDVCRRLKAEAGDTRHRNWYQKLVTVIWYQKLARVSVSLVPVFFWYQILVWNRTQLYSITETVGHVTQTVQRDWPVCCYCFCCH